MIKKHYKSVSKNKITQIVKMLKGGMYDVEVQVDKEKNIITTLNIHKIDTEGDIVKDIAEIIRSKHEAKDEEEEESEPEPSEPEPNSDKGDTNTKYVFFSYIDKNDLSVLFWAVPTILHEEMFISWTSGAFELLRNYVKAGKENIKKYAQAFHKYKPMPDEVKNIPHNTLPEDYVPEIFTIGLMEVNGDTTNIINCRDVTATWIKDIKDCSAVAGKIYDKYCNKERGEL